MWQLTLCQKVGKPLVFRPYVFQVSIFHSMCKCFGWLVVCVLCMSHVFPTCVFPTCAPSLGWLYEWSVFSTRHQFYCMSVYLGSRSHANANFVPSDPSDLALASLVPTAAYLRRHFVAERFYSNRPIALVFPTMSCVFHPRVAFCNGVRSNNSVVTLSLIHI